MMMLPSWKIFFYFVLFKNFLQCCVGFSHTTPRISHNYICIPSLPSLSPLVSHPSRSSQSARLGSPCYTATSHQLSILYLIVYVCVYIYIYIYIYIYTHIYTDATFSICPILSLPHCAQKSVLYICVSIPSLKISSSIPFF